MGVVRFTDRDVSIDWLRVSMPESRRGEFMQKLTSLWGEPTAMRGRWTFEHSVQFSNKAMVHWGGVRTQRDATNDGPGGLVFCVDVPGGALGEMDPRQRFVVCRDLCLGGKVTRVDVAVDSHHYDGVGLIDAMIGGCRRGELTGAKLWEPREVYRAGELDGYGVNIGRRGRDGSGKYVRCYDKGLETGEKPRGVWERFEVEFSGDCAAEVGSVLFQGDDDWERRAWSRAAGAIGFLEGDSAQRKSARKVPEWWAAWIGDALPESTMSGRTDRSLERFVKWVAATVMPTCARLADETDGFTPFQVLEHLIQGECRGRGEDKFMRAMVQEFNELLARRPMPPF